MESKMFSIPQKKYLSLNVLFKPLKIRFYYVETYYVKQKTILDIN